MIIDTSVNGLKYETFSSLRSRFNSKYSDSSRPTLGLAGFYGYGNYGDELFLDVWDKYLGYKYNLKILNDLEQKPFFSESFSESLESVDGILIGGGDILQPWNIDARYWNPDYLKKPVWIAGIGVPLRANSNQSEKERVIAKMNRFISHPSVRCIHARDQVSFNWIKSRFGDTCKTFWSPDIVSSLRDTHFVRTNQIHSPKKNLGVVVRSRKGKESSDDFSYIERFIERSHSMGWHTTIITLATGRTLLPDLYSSLRLSVNCPVAYVFSNSISQLTSALMNQDALFSMKFHGTVAAMMAGIPSVVGVPTLKNREFTNQLSVKELCIGFESPKLAELDVSSLRGPSKDAIDKVHSLAHQSILRIVDDIDHCFGMQQIPIE
jgi:exopolysaccharide biosynthesis predicted pyruvyltransferase EpsI